MMNHFGEFSNYELYQFMYNKVQIKEIWNRFKKMSTLLQ